MKQLLSLIVLTASVICASAQIGGNAITLYSYGPTSGTWPTPDGTSNTNTFTAPLRAVDISKATTIGIGAYYVGKTLCTNPIVIQVWPSYDGVNKATIHAGSTPIITNVLSVFGTGDVPVYASTNISTSVAGFANTATAPYLLFQLSRAGVNVADTEMTNAWVRVTLKN